MKPMMKPKQMNKTGPKYMKITDMEKMIVRGKMDDTKRGTMKKKGK